MTKFIWKENKTKIIKVDLQNEIEIEVTGSNNAGFVVSLNKIQITDAKRTLEDAHVSMREILNFISDDTQRRLEL